ncbi:ABC transporter permease [Novosphingobium soli]|uniref:ABC transporter permease n=1 Tax=Novosphingobium soli TaxID=574956 RepID=A0ABV6CWP1_9SPHN
MTSDMHSGRLSTLAAAWVVARRDFTAILLSRTFFFFLLGPLFPVIVGGLAGSLSQRVDGTAQRPAIGVAMTAQDAAAMLDARDALAARLGEDLPPLVPARRTETGEHLAPAVLLRQSTGRWAAVLSGTPAAPVLTGPPERVERWRGAVAMIAAQARDGRPLAWPAVRLEPTASGDLDNRRDRLRTAQGAQTLLFLLTMMLAGMVLSNLVEEKANKIIEVLAAAIPMEAVFLGKLFAMLGVSLVGIAAWGGVGGALVLAAQSALPQLPAPAVGWPLLIALGVVYFSMAYLLLGSVFLAIGAMAATVREVQTLSMPVTMLQLLVFFFASYAMTVPGSATEIAAILVPFSSPFAMLARAAQAPQLLPHLGAVLWQALWVAVLVRLGSGLFRRRVMKSGPQGTGRRLRFGRRRRESGRARAGG